MKQIHSRTGFLSVLALLLLGVLVSSTSAATPAQIQTAIDRGKSYLYSVQKNGNWEILPKPDPAVQGGWKVENTQFGGLTAIATFALLASGEDPQDPRIKEAIEFLKKTETHGVYALGIRCQIWNMIPSDKSVQAAILRDRDLLLAGMSAKGPSIGFYGYDVQNPGTICDHSSSQFAVLGMWALEQAGAEVPTRYWQIVDSGWRRQQLGDASWAYEFPIVPGDNGTSVGTLSMAAAGLATLYITQDYTNPAAKCTGNINDPAIDQGMNWIGKQLPSLASGGREFYALFGVSRVGLASGYKSIGGVDWFTFGADRLVGEQQSDGHWGDDSENPKFVPATSFAMLFLSRGRAPLMMNKLSFDIVTGKQRAVGDRGKPVETTAPADWNQRPRDVANVTRVIGKQLETQLNWQIVSLHQKREDLHAAPLLYMAGSLAPKLSEADQAILKTYIEEGGMVLGNADCESSAFAEGFRKLGEAMFPGRKFALLPTEHPIYSAGSFPRRLWKTKPQLEGISNGDRELMLLVPRGDPARNWQTQSFPNIKSDPLSQMMIDILLYADDQESFRKRGETYLLSPDQTIHADRTLKVARIKYAGNWDPEPGGWRRLAVAMHNDRHIDLDVRPVDPLTEVLDSSYQAAHLTLAGEISLSDPAITSIRNYVQTGGTLVVDVAGGAAVDRTSAETLLGKIFPAAPRPLPHAEMSDPIYHAGSDVKDVAFRHFAKMSRGNLKTPQLSKWVVGERDAVIYSPDDISAGLVGQPIGGIVGYEPESATRLMENILSYAGKH